MRIVSTLIALAWCVADGALCAATPYDPLTIPKDFTSKNIDLDVLDKTRNRVIPVRIYLAQNSSNAPVVLFSHGLGGSREGSAFLGRHWAARGYVAVFLQHPGSDTEVWRGTAVGQRLRSMQQAASWDNLLLRVKDVPAVLDQLEEWNAREGHALNGRMDLQHIGMAGHSFGAVTAQALGGQKYGARSFADPRIKAAVLMSPSTPHLGGAEQAFADVKIPWLLMTGTKDTSFINNVTAESRLAVYPALPHIPKYELVLDGAEHSVFTERPLPGDREPRNPNHHRVILALSTAFWDAWLRNNAEAKAWLEGQGARTVLEEKDRWKWQRD